MKLTQAFSLFVSIILMIVPGLTYAGEKKIANIDVPLPDDIKIIECAADVPKEIATFSGVWEGTWAIDGVKAVLVVEEINSKEAKVIYSRGKMEGFYEVPADYGRYTAIVMSEKLQIEFGRDENYWFTFDMENNLNEINGTLKRRTSLNKIRMTKIK